jgi:hypothetical protein
MSAEGEVLVAEESYSAYQRQVLAPAAKAAADAASKLSTTIKSLQRAAAQGDVDRVGAIAGTLPGLVQSTDRAAADLAAITGGFDFDAYLATGFHADFVDACRAQNLPPLEGQFPSYEVFPLRVRILPDRHRAVVGARTVRDLEPAALAALVRKEIDALTRRSFDAARFLKEVSHAYDVCLAIRERTSAARRRGEAAISREGMPIGARDVYAELAPTRLAQAAYTLSMFAFDLGKLQQSGEHAVDGRHISLGSTREGGRALRSFDSAGREFFIGSIAFVQPPQ